MYQHAYSGAYCAPNCCTHYLISNTCSQCSSDFAW